MAKQHPGDSVRKDLQRAKELRKEMNRSADGVVRSLRRAADGLRRSAAASNQS
jgi:hypothetical protein